LPEAIQNVYTFLRNLGILESEFVFMSCGDFDGNHLKKEAKRKNIAVPNFMKRWINLKKVFPRHLVQGGKPAFDFDDANTIYEIHKPATGGMEAMLKDLKIDLQGKHHSGIDDCRNLARIVLELMNRGFEVKQGMVNS